MPCIGFPSKRYVLLSVSMKTECKALLLVSVCILSPPLTSASLIIPKMGRFLQKNFAFSILFEICSTAQILSISSVLKGFFPLIFEEKEFGLMPMSSASCFCVSAFCAILDRRRFLLTTSPPPFVPLLGRLNLNTFICVCQPYFGTISKYFLKKYCLFGTMVV